LARRRQGLDKEPTLSEQHFDHEFAQLTAPPPRDQPRPLPREQKTFQRALSALSKCAGTRLNGTPCNARAAATSGYCVAHDPRHSAAEHKLWRQRGQLAAAKRQVARSQAENPDAPSFATQEGVRKCLEETAQKVAQNRLAPSQATAIGALAALAIRLAELESESRVLALELKMEQEERELAQRFPRVSVTEAQR
jgi:hypothetical protein